MFYCLLNPTNLEIDKVSSTVFHVQESDKHLSVILSSNDLSIMFGESNERKNALQMELYKYCQKIHKGKEDMDVNEEMDVQGEMDEIDKIKYQDTELISIIQSYEYNTLNHVNFNENDKDNKKVLDDEYKKITELVMQKLLNIDAIEVNDNTKIKIKDTVVYYQSLLDKVDDLKTLVC